MSFMMDTSNNTTPLIRENFAHTTTNHQKPMKHTNQQIFGSFTNSPIKYHDQNNNILNKTFDTNS